MHQKEGCFVALLPGGSMLFGLTYALHMLCICFAALHCLDGSWMGGMKPLRSSNCHFFYESLSKRGSNTKPFTDRSSSERATSYKTSLESLEKTKVAESKLRSEQEAMQGGFV